MGKSWLALALAISIACGGIALGVAQVEAGDVLYLALEDTQRRLQSRLEILLAGRNAPSKLKIATAWRRLDDGGIDQLHAWLSEHQAARLVVVDTLAKVRPARRRSDSFYDSDYEAINALKRCADRFGVAIIVIHHLRKLDAADPIDSISGTLGLSGAADTLLVLLRERGRHDAALFVTGRDVDEVQLALKWDARHASWTLIGDAASYRLSKERVAVLQMFGAVEDRPLTPTQAAAKLGKKIGTVKKLLRAMAKDGQLASDGGRYRPVRDGTPGNRGALSNRGIPGSSTQTTVTGVTESKRRSVTAPIDALSPDDASGHPVTQVTVHQQSERLEADGSPTTGLKMPNESATGEDAGWELEVVG